MLAFDVVIFILSAVESVQKILATQIQGLTLWQLILLTWIPLGLPLALVFTKLVYIRHGRPFEAREKQALALGALGGWATLAISIFYVVPLSLLFFILTRIFKSRPIRFMAGWLLIPVNLFIIKINETLTKIKILLSALVEKIIDKIFPAKIL